MSNQLPFEPPGSKILIEVDEAITVSKAGIQIYSNTSDEEGEQKFQQTGTVVAIGPLAYKYSDGFHPWVKVGQKVAFDRYEGSFHKDAVTGKSYRCLADTRFNVIINTIRGVE